MLDTIGQIIWFGAFAAPLLSIILFWHYKQIGKVSRFFLGLLVGVIIGFLMLGIGLAIALRNGLGPS